jgi:hypothetical protein
MAWFYEKNVEINKDEIKSLVLESATECTDRIC